MRQRNDSGYPLNVPELGRVVWPGEELRAPALVTGCTNLDTSPVQTPPSPPPVPVTEPVTGDTSNDSDSPPGDQPETRARTRSKETPQ